MGEDRVGMPRPVLWYTDGESRAPAIDPYKRLWIAVLEGCKTDLDLARSVKASPSLNTANADRERDWLLSGNHEPKSFLWVCDVVGCEPDAVREALLHPRPSMVRGASRLAGDGQEGE